MMRPRVWAAAAGLGLVLVSGCSSEPTTTAPPLRALAKQKEPDAAKLPIVKSEQVAPDPEKAIQNYRELLRLAPDDEKRAEAMRRAADLKVEIEDLKGNQNPKALNDSIGTYQQLLREHPDSRGNDSIYYQLARAYQNSGQTDLAIQTLRTLGDRYPGSTLIGDARFRSAELLYNLNRYDEAEREYRFVLSLGQSTSFFESAQYKFGWSLYKQNKYDEALPVFFTILDRELPPGELEDPEAALEAVPKNKRDLAQDSLRVCSLSFTAQGGGKAINDFFARRGGEPRFYPLVYNALGNLFVEKQRYTDAAATYAAFIERHQKHASAPKFQTRVIDAYAKAGSPELVVREKERYVTAYAPGTDYWAGKQPTPEVLAEVRKDYEDLGRHYQATAQAKHKAQAGSGKAEFITASKWYERILAVFPQDPKLPEVNLLYADSLFDGGSTAQAAEQYLKTAYGYGQHPKAPEAANAAVQAWQRLATEVGPAERPGALRRSVDASLKLADTFPQHPQWAVVVTRAAENLYELKSLDEAIKVAQRLLAANPPASIDLRRSALAVVADSRFAQAKYPEAEAAYGDLLKLTAADSPNRKLVVEQLAGSIYKQGEAARTAGDQRAAAAAFLRVGTVTPDATIRPNADYDAASAFIALSDWPQAETTLEGFRGRFPTHQLIPDVDKKLATTYQKDNKPAQAASAYLRIAARQSETPDTRREAAWLAATLYDGAKLGTDAARAYELYVTGFPQPLDRSLQARRRLADIAQANGDRGRYQYWLREIVTADGNAAVGRSDETRSLAAQAALELAYGAAADARLVKITQPFQKSLAARKQATENAVQALNRAAAYGFAEQTTAATHELGTVYRDFGRALLDSEKPKNLKADELEQYQLLLEEQADPFDQKAIAAYEANLARVKQDLWNDSIRKSVEALAEMAPAKYGKREQREASYDSLR